MGVIKKAVKSIGKLIGYDSDAVKDAANQQAEATTKAANEQAVAVREQSNMAQRQQETLLAQQQASNQAAELLNKPVEGVDVDISGDDGEVDEATGKRLKPRDKYSAASINI